MQTTNSKPFAPVALVQAQQYDPALIDRALERLLELLNIPAEWFCGKRVLIKPNLLMRRQPQEATTTHPLLIKALADWLYRAKAAQVIIADSPGGLYTPASLRGIYQTCGMQQAAEQSGAVLNFDVGYRTVAAKDACICREFNLIHPVVQADLILSVGKLKTHCMTGLSGGVKNLFGCIPGLQKPQMHYRFQNTGDFCSMLVDLAQTVAPALTIIDAVDAMEGNGPSGGTVRHTGCLIASRSPFCLDLLLSRLIALKPQQAPTVLHSIRRRLCPDDPSGLTVLNPDSLPLTIPDFVHPQSKTVDFSGNLPPFLRPAVQKQPSCSLLDRLSTRKNASDAANAHKAVRRRSSASKSTRQRFIAVVSAATAATRCAQSKPSTSAAEYKFPFWRYFHAINHRPFPLQNQSFAGHRPAASQRLP